MSNEPATHNVVITRVFAAPVEQVWSAWRDPELVMRWWGPNGFTSPLAKMDFREGGTSLVCMRAPAEFGGQAMYNTWTYTKIVPTELIEFIQHFTDKDGNPLSPQSLGLPPGIPDEVRHVITFKPVSDSKTEMTVTEYGYASQDLVKMSRMGMEQCLDKMAAIFANA